MQIKCINLFAFPLDLLRFGFAASSAPLTRPYLLSRESVINSERWSVRCRLWKYNLLSRARTPTIFTGNCRLDAPKDLCPAGATPKCVKSARSGAKNFYVSFFGRKDLCPAGAAPKRVKFVETGSKIFFPLFSKFMIHAWGPAGFRAVRS